MYSATIKTADWHQIAADTLARMTKEKAEMVDDEDENSKWIIIIHKSMHHKFDPIVKPLNFKF
jgi:hypothetical protein